VFRAVDGVRVVDLRCAGELGLAVSLFVGALLLLLHLRHRSFPRRHLRADGLLGPATLATMAPNATCLGGQ